MTPKRAYRVLLSAVAAASVVWLVIPWRRDAQPLTTALDVDLATCIADRGGVESLESVHSVLARCERDVGRELLVVDAAAMRRFSLEAAANRVADLDVVLGSLAEALPPSRVPLITDPRKGTIGFAPLLYARRRELVSLCVRASIMRLWRRCLTDPPDGRLDEIGPLLRLVVASLTDSCLIDEPGGEPQFGITVAVETTECIGDMIESGRFGRVRSRLLSDEISAVLRAWPTDRQVLRAYLLACEVDTRNAFDGLAREEDIASGHGCAPDFRLIARLSVDDARLIASWRELRALRRCPEPRVSSAATPVVVERVLPAAVTAIDRARKVRTRLQVLLAASYLLRPDETSFAPSDLEAGVTSGVDVQRPSAGGVRVVATDPGVRFSVRIPRE